MIKNLTRIENLIVLLVAVSAIAIAVYQSTPREYSIRPGDSWGTTTVDDRHDGGNSDVIDQSTDREFAYKYSIGDGSSNPFALLMLRPLDSDLLFDWRWMESISITAHIEGKEKENFRLQLRNREEETYVANDILSRKYNEACLPLTNRRTTQTISLDQFYVPGWWTERVSVNRANTTPRFDNIEWIEFITANVPEQGECRVVIEEIKISGNWIPASLFYRSILCIWLGFGTLVAIGQIFRLQKQLSESASTKLSLQRQTAKLTELATLDPLTQLFNRRGIRPHTTLAMKELRQTGHAFSLIMFDIDNFKAINDLNGHSHGDKVLQHVALIVSETVTSNDPVARWGGEEFLVVCRNSKLSRARSLAEQIRQRIEREVEITCSFGVCELDADLEFGEALDMVDECLYQAKRSGKNCIKAATDVAPAELMVETTCN